MYRAYDEPFLIEPNGEYIVYAMLVDESMNITYLRSDRITLDNIRPVIGGIENGKTYCEAQTVTIDEKYIDTVTVNGTKVTLDENRGFTLSPADGEQKIVVTDKAGNTAEMTVTVHGGHTFGEWASNGDGTHSRECTVDGCKGVETMACSGGKATCTEKAKCAVCGEEYGDVLGHDFTTSWTHDDNEHWKQCSRCDAKDDVSPHTWDNGTVTTAPTCTKAGERTYTCTECGATKTEPIDATGHSWKQEWNSDETHHWHECANGCEFARYWMHNGFINVDNQKMSKSLGNFRLVRDIAQEFDLEAVRLFLLSAQYRNPINFTRELIEQANTALTRIRTARERLAEAKEGPATAEDESFIASLAEHEKRFCDAMDDDLNTADALGAMFDYARAVNTFVTEPRSKEALERAAKLFDDMTNVLGILQHSKSEEFPKEAVALLNERAEARKAKNWARADQIREELKAMGFAVEDSKEGAKLKRL